MFLLVTSSPLFALLLLTGVVGALPVHVVGIDSDVLYPLSEQENLAELFPRGKLSVVRNDDGHDGFLLAQDAIGPLIDAFLQEQEVRAGQFALPREAFAPTPIHCPNGICAVPLRRSSWPSTK